MTWNAEEFEKIANEKMREIESKRKEILEDYMTAWFAGSIPDGVDASWVVQNVELVEQRTEEGFRWFMRFKPNHETKWLEFHP